MQIQFMYKSNRTPRNSTLQNVGRGEETSKMNSCNGRHDAKFIKGVCSSKPTYIDWNIPARKAVLFIDMNSWALILREALIIPTFDGNIFSTFICISIPFGNVVSSKITMNLKTVIIVPIKIRWSRNWLWTVQLWLITERASKNIDRDLWLQNTLR